MSTQIIEAFEPERDSSAKLSVLRWAGADGPLHDRVMFTISIENDNTATNLIDLTRQEMVEIIGKLVEGLVV